MSIDERERVEKNWIVRKIDSEKCMVLRIEVDETEQASEPKGSREKVLPWFVAIRILKCSSGQGMNGCKKK